MQRSPHGLGFRIGVAAVTACLAGTPARAASVQAKEIVGTDTAVPGGPFEPGTLSTFTDIESGPAAGNQLVFYGRVLDGGIVGQGLYAVDFGSAPEAVADTRSCLGDPCNASQNVFSNTGTNFLNDSFDGTTVAFDARWIAPPVRDSIWAATASTLGLLVDEGDAIPGGGSFASLEGVAVDGNEVAFTGRPSSPGTDGIYAVPTSGGAVRLVVNGATPVPGAGGALFEAASLTNVAARDGLLVFRGRAVGSGLGDTFLYAEDNGSLRVVADSQTAAPGLGMNFTSVSSYRTDGGDIVFFGQTTSILGRGIFAERNGTLVQTPIWLRGAKDPCDNDGLDFVDSYALGDGAVVFVSGGGLYSARVGVGGLSRLLASGDTVDGKTIGSVGSGTLHPEAVADGAAFPRLSFTDGSMGIYCVGIPTTPQCGAAPVPAPCLAVPEPVAQLQLFAAAASLASLWRRRAR